MNGRDSRGRFVKGHKQPAGHPFNMWRKVGKYFDDEIDHFPNEQQRFMPDERNLAEVAVMDGMSRGDYVG